MNAQACSGSYRTAARAHVAAFFAHEDEAKQKQRERLVFLRNLAASRAVYSSAWSRDLYWQLNAIANECLSVPLRTEDLKAIADQLTRLGSIATNLSTITSELDAADDS